MQPSVARGTLDAARFFVSRAAQKSVGDDTRALRHFLEAAIVFGRSVTFHIQKEFSKRPGFDQWYATWQTRLKNDPLATYFLDKRNYVLKVGRVDLRFTLNANVGEFQSTFAHVSARVIRGAPWYRRSPRVLVDDAIQPLREWLSRRRDRHARRRKEKQLREQALASLASRDSSSVGFVDAPFADQPATELLSRYLDQLDTLVSEAESRFGVS